MKISSLPLSKLFDEFSRGSGLSFSSFPSGPYSEINTGASVPAESCLCMLLRIMFSAVL